MRACTDLSGYALVSAPMLFMTRNGIEEKLRRFVEGGGVLLVTYWSGVVDACDLAHLGPAPHDLTDVLGLRATELDALRPELSNGMRLPDGTEYRVTELCGLVDCQEAQVEAVYTGDWYAGQACLTRRAYGKGEAWYLAAQVEQAGLNALYARLAERAGLPKAMEEELPQGVVAIEQSSVVFLQNYAGASRRVSLLRPYEELLSGETLNGEVELPVCGVLVLRPLR